MSVVVLLIGLAFAGVCWRLGTLMAAALTTAIDRQLAVRERAVAVEERRIALEEKARSPRPKAEPMPPDLRARIASLDEDWARDDEERTIMALFAELDNWEQVRMNLRPLPSSTGTDTIFTPDPSEFIR